MNNPDFSNYRQHLTEHLNTSVESNPDLYLKMLSVVDNVIENDKHALFLLLKQHAREKEYEGLAFIAEYIRASGIFYQDYQEIFGEILDYMLVLAKNLLDTEEAFREPFIFIFISNSYDFIFHQVRFSKWPEGCAVHYFELTNRVLDVEFLTLCETGHTRYGECLYFIDMADRYFFARDGEFMQLWKKIEEHIKLSQCQKWHHWPETAKLLAK